jgi:hypothetical protein
MVCALQTADRRVTYGLCQSFGAPWALMPWLLPGVIPKPKSMCWPVFAPWSSTGLCDPSSKLGVLRWLETVALPVDFGFTQGLPEHQHLLRAMDVLDEYSDALGAGLATLMRPLIDQDLSVVFYDLTTVEVTGQTELEDDVRAYGRGKSGMVERQFVLSSERVNDFAPPLNK